MWKRIATKFMNKANVEIGKDIIIRDKSIYKDVVTRGSIGFGEGYMFGKWDSPHLDVLITKILNSKLDKSKLLGAGIRIVLWLKSTILNLQNRKHCPDLTETHYNAGNYLFKSFLDPNMIYTCAYFQNTNNLAKAQLDKIKIIGKKLKLQPGDRVLDIGCGWGGTAKIISEMFNVHVTGVSDAKEMIDYAKKNNSSKKVNFICSDYREIKGKFNKIYNIGFLEHVGPKNLRGFMKQMNNLLKDDGIFLTHTIGGRNSNNFSDPWIDKYIFPHGVIPSKKQIEKSTKGIFEQRDFEAFGKYYEITLQNWSKNLNKNWHKIKSKFKNPGVFKRMMDYYLLCSVASFRMGSNDLWQFVFTKPNQVKDYKVYRLPKQKHLKD